MSLRAQAFHQSPWQGVIYITGGAASFLAELLNTPGASASVLEAQVPYATQALTELLGRAPEQAASNATARALAAVAYHRAGQLSQGQQFGFGCTASLATNRVKKGVHRAHWAIQTSTHTYTFEATFDGDRHEEEVQLNNLIWQSLQDHLLSDSADGLSDYPSEVHFEHATLDTTLAPLYDTTPHKHCLGDHDGKLILPGSFNPLHDGHREMIDTAQQITGNAGALELTVFNADKPPLDFVSLNARLKYAQEFPLWLTNVANYADKAQLFSQCTFALGIDTLVRIADLRFYQHQQEKLEEAFNLFEDYKTQFLVFGRKVKSEFVSLDDVSIPLRLKSMCQSVPESKYRNDLSSTALRQAASVQQD